MSLTSARVLDGNDTWGSHGVCIRKFTGDAAYPAGGYALAGSNFGFGNKPLEGVVLLGVLTTLAANYTPVYDALNKKLIINAGGGGGASLTYAPANVAGSVAANIGIAGGALPVNGGLISNLAAANNTTAFTLATQPDFPRNVSISFKNTNAGASTGNAVSVVIVGTFRGAAQTETISFTALELTSTAQNEVATKFGAKPFDTITSITPSAAQPANWQHAAGPGSKFGLTTPTLNNAESDITEELVNGVTQTITGTYSSTNATVNFGVTADGDDLSVTYVASGQAGGGTDLSGCTWILMGICRGT